MNKIIKIGIFFIAFICLATAGQAQKFGYVNSSAILAEMAEVKQARSKLEALETQLKKKGEQMVTEFQTEYQSLAEKEKQGVLSPKQLQEEAGKLEGKKVKIQEYQQEMTNTLLEKEQTELTPIIERVNQAIQDVAKEGGFQFIFDAGTQVPFILYAEESSDVTGLVKAKL